MSTANLVASKLFNLSGRVGVVTGGGTGIGLMCSQALAANGAKVYIIGRRTEALENAAKTHSPNEFGGSIIPLQGDITSLDSIQKLVKEISAKEKFLSFLINNAGVAGPTSEVEKGDESAEALSEEYLKVKWEDWTTVYNTNVFATYYLSSALLPLLSKGTAESHGWSSGIVNITSISGITNTTQHHNAYNTSKAAAIQLTTMLGQEFSRVGVKVRVNSLAPGIFPSEMTADTSNDQQKSHIDAKGYREDKNIPAGRPGRDEDMAQAVLTLTVNQYCNGSNLVVDGGYLLGNP